MLLDLQIEIGTLACQTRVLQPAPDVVLAAPDAGMVNDPWHNLMITASPLPVNRGGAGSRSYRGRLRSSGRRRVRHVGDISVLPGGVGSLKKDPG